MTSIRVKLSKSQTSIVFLAGLALFLLPVTSYLGYLLANQDPPRVVYIDSDCESPPETVIDKKTNTNSPDTSPSHHHKVTILRDDFFNWFD